MVHCIAYSSGQHTVEFGVLCMSKELSQSLENLGGAQTLPGRFSVPSISGIYTRHKRTRWDPEINNRETNDHASFDVTRDLNGRW